MEFEKGINHRVSEIKTQTEIYSGSISRYLIDCSLAISIDPQLADNQRARAQSLLKQLSVVVKVQTLDTQESLEEFGSLLAELNQLSIQNSSFTDNLLSIISYFNNLIELKGK